MKQLGEHFDAWGLVGLVLAIAFHAGIVWAQLHGIRLDLRKLCRKIEHQDERIRALELDNARR